MLFEGGWGRKPMSLGKKKSEAGETAQQLRFTCAAFAEEPGYQHPHGG